MNTEKTDIKKLGIRARVAYSIICSERVLRALDEYPAVSFLSRQALEDAWKWQLEMDITAHQLYSYIHPLLEFYDSVKVDQKAQRALFSVVSAMYYATSEARAVEFSRGASDCDDPLPNDLADVSEEDLEQSLEFATEAASDGEAEKEWQAKVFSAILKNFKSNQDDLGSSVSRDYLASIA